jgi:hypothetical protein
VTVLAHGIGGRTDLPLPSELVLQAGGFVVLVSFLAVGLAWRRPRFGTEEPEPGDRADPGPTEQLPRGLEHAQLAVRCLLLALLGYLVARAFTGNPDPDHNPAPRALYVLLWVGLVPASLVFGPVWRVVNPLRALHRGVCALLRVPPAGVREPPSGLGYWPAAIGLAVFIWLELVPDARADPAVVGAFIAGYAALITAAATVYGARWFSLADPFEVYSTLIAALSPVGLRTGAGPNSGAGPRSGAGPNSGAGPRTGAGPKTGGPGLEFRNPLRGLNRVPPAPGLVAMLAVWWGSTVFDGVSGTSWWATTSQLAAARSGLPTELLATVVLVGLIALVALSYRLATGALSATLVSTLIPIAVGYTIAHYASLLLVEGPRALTQLVDPSGAAPPLAAVPAPVLIAAVQVTAILVGHVVGVVAAHDRVLGAAENPTTGVPGKSQVLTDQRRLADEIPLVLLMILYTMIGIYLLVIA